MGLVPNSGKRSPVWVTRQYAFVSNVSDDVYRHGMWRLQNSTWAQEEAGVPDHGDDAGKISNLFAGILAYGVLEFAWFGFANPINQELCINSHAAVAAFRKGGSTYTRPES